MRKVPTRNMDNVKAGDCFHDKDPRMNERTVKVIQVEGGKALCENVATGRRTRIDLHMLAARFTRLPRS